MRHHKHRQEESTELLLYGMHVVQDILRQDASLVRQLMLIEHARPELQAIAEQAKSLGVRIELRSKAYLDEQAQGGVHQGILVRCAPFHYLELDDLLCKMNKQSLFLVLDSIVDPQNLGTLLRNALWFGVSGVILPTDRAASVTATVMKASAGAALRLPIARVVNLARTLETLSEEYVHCVAAVLAEGAVAPWEVNFRQASALVIGSEEKGVRPLLRQKCTQLVQIPRLGELESLNAAQAGAVLLYEAARQRALGR